KRLAEVWKTRELAGLRIGPKIGVIAVLLAAAIIDAGRLELAVRILAEPGIFVGGRERNGVQPIDGLSVGDAHFSFEIRPIAAHAPARVARLAVAAVPQHGALRFTRPIDRPKRA